MHDHDRIGSPSRSVLLGARPGWGLRLLAVLTLLPVTGAAQEPGTPEAEPDSVGEAQSARVARADSIRASLQRPPGDRGGLTLADAIRAPFYLVGAGPAIAYAGGREVVRLLERTGLLREDPRDDQLYLAPDAIGPRSWPALTATWRPIEPFYVRAGHSLRGYELYEAGAQLGDTLRGAEAVVRYRHLRQPHFWGVGPGTDEVDRSDFSLVRTEAGGRVWITPGKGLRLEVGAAWERSDVGRGEDGSEPDLQDVFDADTLFGSAEEVELLRLAGRLSLDRTRLDGLQPRGVRGQLGYTVFEGVGGTRTGYHRVAADLQGFLPVDDDRMLALRLLAEDHLAESGSGVPFTRLAELGDEEGLRGYASRRFRDRALLAAQLEWRYEVWWHSGAAESRGEGFAFLDYGTVGPSLDGIDGDDFELTPGIGVRFVRRGAPVAEGYVAFGGDDSPRFGVTLGASF